MKKLFSAALILAITSAQADDPFGAWQDSLPSGQPTADAKTLTSTEAPDKVVERSSDTGKICDEEQTSMPLKALTGMIMKRDGEFDISHNSDGAELKVTASHMVSNCSSMLDWKLKDLTGDSGKSYAIEVKFLKNLDCDDTKGCMYKVAKLDEKGKAVFEDIRFKPNRDGFNECLKYTGVLVDKAGKTEVNPKAIYASPLLKRFPKVNEDGPVSFVSHGARDVIKEPARYGDFSAIKSCDYFETFKPGFEGVISAETKQREAMNKKIAELNNCKDYSELASFVKINSEYEDQFQPAIVKLLEEEVKKSMAAITEGKGTANDTKVVDDFRSLILNPLIQQSVTLGNLLATKDGNTEGNQARMKAVSEKLKSYAKAPFFSDDSIKKMVAAGKFEDAKNVFSIKVTMDNYAKMGVKEKNVVITPAVALKTIVASEKEFATFAEKAQIKYELKHGMRTGLAEEHAAIVRGYGAKIQETTNNYNQEIQNEYARINSKCQQYFVAGGSAKCIQDSQLRIQQLQTELQEKLKYFNAEAQKAKVTAEEYAKDEGEGARYLATENGEAAPKDAAPKLDFTSSQPTPVGNGTYQFNYQGGVQQPQQQMMMNQQGGQQQMMNPMMYQQQQNPYQYSQQYTPYSLNGGAQFGANYAMNGMMNMGGMNNGMMMGNNMMGGNGYSFNYQGMGQQQQMPMGYSMMNNPMQSYGQYNMYR